jgi:hypothetical protein
MSAIAAANSSATSGIAVLLSNAASSATVAGTPATKATTSGSSANGNPVPATEPNGTASVVVTLSSAASAVLAAAASGQENFATVASDARAALDAGYQTAGKVAGFYTTGAEWKADFGGMDRRSLFAVVSNQGGQFSQMERDNAQFLMRDQQATAMGLTNGAYQSDPAAALKNGVAFMDNVSPEEKAGSFEWAQQRAAVQYAYECAMRQKDEVPEKLDSSNPVVKMLKGALDALRSLNDSSKKLQDMPQYKQAQAAFASDKTTGSLLDTAA